jgi:hypothetical protein
VKQDKTKSVSTSALEGGGSDAGAAKQRGEPKPQKYKVVWWMLDDTPCEFTQVFKTKEEAKAFVLGLREHGYIAEDDLKVRKA